MALCATPTESPTFRNLFELDLQSTSPRTNNLIWTTNDLDLTQFTAELDRFLPTDRELIVDPEANGGLHEELQVPLNPQDTMMDEFDDLHPEVLEAMITEDLDLDIKPQFDDLNTPPPPAEEEEEEEDRKPSLVPSPPNAEILPDDIHDDLDVVIFDMFPMSVLRLERAAFNKWKKANRIRKLNVDETKRLAKIRRTMLARVYAERARQRRDRSHRDTKSECDQLRSENAKLKAQVAKFEKMFAAR